MQGNFAFKIVVVGQFGNILPDGADNFGVQVKRDFAFGIEIGKILGNKLIYQSLGIFGFQNRNQFDDNFFGHLQKPVFQLLFFAVNIDSQSQQFVIDIIQNGLIAGFYPRLRRLKTVFITFLAGDTDFFGQLFLAVGFYFGNFLKFGNGLNRRRFFNNRFGFGLGNRFDRRRLWLLLYNKIIE